MVMYKTKVIVERKSQLDGNSRNEWSRIIDAAADQPRKYGRRAICVICVIQLEIDNVVDRLGKLTYNWEKRQ